jgi:teichuronic acid biosynthesis glycosyltransferase TuaC
MARAEVRIAMKICLYTETALPKVGGQELVVDNLAREYLAQGHDVVVMGQFPRSPQRGFDRRLPYPVVRHPRFISTWRGIALYRHFIRALHRKFPFDVLHCHSVHPCGYLGALCKDRLEAALVITSHGGDIRDGNVRLAKPGLRERAIMTLQQADAVVSIGPFTTSSLKRLCPTAPLVEIPNGVALEQLSVPVVRPQGLDPRIEAGAYVLFLGRLHPRKGADLLIDAWARLATTGDEVLVVAGTGDQHASLAAQTRRLGLQDRVCFVGQVQGTTKTWLLQNAVGVCLPSRGWEASPLVVLESYAAGKPLIGTRIAGLEDLVQPGKTGWLVPPDSSDRLATALRELLADRARSCQMGLHARQAAAAYSWQSIAARHLQLYHRVCRGSLARQAA